MRTPKGEINDKIFDLVKDEALLAKMAQCKSDRECYDLVKDRIQGVSFEEFKASMAIANEYLNETQSGLLNESELDQVAGGKSEMGKDNYNTMMGLIGAGAAVGGAIAAAAAA